MKSPSELRIMCKAQLTRVHGVTSETETQTHGSSHAVETELVHFPRMLESRLLR